MSFSSLPNEIVSEIISFVSLAPDSNQDHLWPLSVCSRRLHNIVEPFLYSSFTEIRTTALLAFLRTILECPRLAPLVKSYEGRDTRTFTKEPNLKFPFEVTRIFHQKDMNEVRELFVSAIGRGEINSDRSYLWLDDMLAGSWDAATALAIICLPNLQKLQFSVMNESRMVSRRRDNILRNDDAFDPMAYRWIYRSLRDAQELQASGDTTSKHSMRKLDTIKLTLSNDHQGVVYFSNIFGLVQLKSLQTFETDHVWLGQTFDPHDLPVPIQVANLSLTNCPEVLGERGYMPSMLQIFNNVECLTYTAIPGHMFVFTTFIDSIHSMAPSLREIVVKGSRDDDPSRRYSPRSAPSMFVALEKVDIMAPYLIRWLEMGATFPGKYTSNKVLWAVEMPKNLKTLIIRECMQSVVIEVRDLVNRKRDECCKFEVLHLEFMHDFPRENAENEVNMLREQCVVAGVVFTVDWNGH